MNIKIHFWDIRFCNEYCESIMTFVVLIKNNHIPKLYFKINRYKISKILIEKVKGLKIVDARVYSENSRTQPF